MTCEDCIHFEVCDSGRHIGEYIEDDGSYSEGVERECETFKYKANFVEVKHGVVIPQWISVKDRLPEDKQNVLTIDSESKMEVCFYEKEWKGVFQQCGGLVKIFNITHWMPLPEPPKKEGADNG